VERRLGIADGETTEDLEYTLDTVACIGACGLAPCMMINHDVHGRLTSKSVLKVFDTNGGEQGEE
jgi:NADH:ubiquinone oxidoreductase subunit E